MMNVVVTAGVERFRPVADRQNLKIVAVSPSDLPMVKCDVDRIRQVVRSILEVSTWQTWKGESATVKVEDRTQGISGRHGRFVSVSFDYPSGRLISGDVQKVVNANEMEWKSVKDSVSIGAFNLAIGKRVVEAHGGEFVIETAPDRTIVRFTLPV
jgi:signal transduction histidine kinase